MLAMRSDHSSQCLTLLDRAAQAGETQEALALTEEAVRIADAQGDLDLGFEARDALMNAAVGTGHYDKLLVAFSWCLAQADQKVDEFRSFSLLWKHKWVIEHLVHFPGISRSQIFDALADFRQRSSLQGYNERPALFLHFCLEMFMGNLRAANEIRERWARVPGDSLADCEACELNRVVELKAALGDHEGAVRSAQPILDGHLQCGEIPHLTHATLLRSFWHTHRRSEAVASHWTGYRLIADNRDFIREQAWHLEHLLRTDEMAAASALLRRHLAWALETRSLDCRFCFLLASRSLLRRWIAAGTTRIQLRLPESLSPLANQGSVGTQALHDWIEPQLQSLSSQFDARNGNRYFTEQWAAADGQVPSSQAA